MTGAYLRVKRGEKFENIEVEHLTDDERYDLFADRNGAELLRWINMLCHKVQENEELLNGLVEEGILEIR